MINLLDYIDRCRRRRWVLDDELSRLETEKKIVSNIKKQLENDRTDASEKNSGKKLDLAWKGSRYNNYLESLDSDVKSCFNTYIINVDAVLDGICDAITRRENERKNQKERQSTLPLEDQKGCRL